MIGKCACSGGLGGKHRELEPHGLLVPEWAAECLAASHVVGRQFDRLGTFACADAAYADALIFERFHDAIETPVLLAEQIACGNAHILKADLRGIGAEPAVFLELGNEYAGRGPLDNEQRDSPAA